jgi:hypothetical protein
MSTKGNQIGTDAFLRSVPLPEKTKTYTPITHGDIIDKVSAELSNAGFIVEGVDYSYSFGGDVALAKVYITSKIDPDMGMLFSWTNSYNKKVKFSCGIGGFIYENKASLFGTEGLSWIRMHTGKADEEAFNIIEQLVDNAEDHFANIIAEKNRMKAQPITIESYGKVMGALYFEHELLKPTQSTAIDREYKNPSNEYTDKDSLWGLYKVLMYGIEGVDITKWMQSQQKLHHMIMVEYTISQAQTERNKADNLDIIEQKFGVIGDEIPAVIDEIAEKIEEVQDTTAHVETDQEYADRVSAIDNVEEVVEQVAEAIVEVIKEMPKIDLPLSNESLEELPKKEEEEFDWNTATPVEAEDKPNPPLKANELREQEAPAVIPAIIEQPNVVEAIKTFDLDTSSEKVLEEIVTEKVGELIQKEMVNHTGNAIPTVDERQDWADKVLTENNSEDDHVGAPEMYSGDVEVVESSGMDTATEVLQSEIDELFPEDKIEPVANLDKPVEIIPPAPVVAEEPKINLPTKDEEIERSPIPKTVEESFTPVNTEMEVVIPDDAEIIVNAEVEQIEKEDPFAVTDEDFLEITEHEGVEVPAKVLQEAALIEKKMAILYGSVKPYTVENTPTQTNVILDDTQECFFISVE